MSEFGFGTLVTNLSNYMGTGHSVRQQERDEQMADYKQREREGIQARVEGAKAAGIHPLVAMGFQAGPGPSTVVGGVREASHMGMDDFGSAPAEAPAPAPASVSEDQDRINKARVRQEEAQADLVELQAHNAYRALAIQPGQAIPITGGSQDLPTAVENRIKGKLRAGIKLAPDEVTASRSSDGMGSALTAGVHPGATDFKIAVGKYPRTIRLPSGKLAESLEDLDAFKTLIALQMNLPLMWDEAKRSIPWALKGYSDDITSVLPRINSSKLFGPKPRRRSGGASGSW